MKTRISMAVLLGLLTMAVVSSQDKQSPSVDDIMTAKLVYAQKTLEALALEDYETIVSNSERLNLLSREASWQVLQTAEYVSHSDDFRRATDSLRAAGQMRNIDAAGLAYVRLTLTCLECHKHVRSQHAK